MKLFVALLLSAAVTAAPPDFTVQTIDGREVTGALADWNSQSLVLRADRREERLALEELLSVVPVEQPQAAPAADVIWVTLTDGTVIAAGSFEAEGKTAEVAAHRVGPLDLPPASVDHVRFQAASQEWLERWKEIVGRETDRDLLVIAGDDSLDYLEGIVRAVGEQQIQFDLDGEVLPVRRSKVFAIRYYRRDRTEEQEPPARITDDDGSTWAVRRAKYTQPAGPVVLETPLGLEAALPLDAIVRVEFAGSALVYLSDLTPDSWKWTPYFGAAAGVASLNKLYRPRTNETLDSEPIVLDGVPYSHGLTLHSRTEMVYRLSEPFKRFQALAGIDDRLRPRGNVELRILGDGRVLFDSAIAGTDPAQPIDLNVEGITTLTVVAGFGGDLGAGDHLILADAKLLR